MSTEINVEWLDCGQQTPYYLATSVCPRCESSWREARYDYHNLGRTLQTLIQERNFDLWRYRQLLPVRYLSPTISLGEGGTPLIQATNFGMLLGNPHLYLKDERQGPTASFKDRQAAVSIAARKEAGITEVVLASTGNVAIAYSAYAARKDTDIVTSCREVCDRR